MKRVVLALLCLSIVVLADQQKVTRLTVYSPNELKEEIKQYNRQIRKDGDEEVIDCELGNFGSVQYGTNTIGVVHVADPYNACNKTQVINTEETRAAFLLVERGECAFADKVYNAQEAQAKIVIIVDTPGNHGKVIMIDNGHGQNVHITSVFIKHEYGKIIKEYIKKNPDQSVNLSIQLRQKKLKDSVVRLWIDPINPLCTKMIHSFNPLRKQIKDNKFKTEPIFNIEKASKINGKDTDCITYQNNSVQFCSPDPDNPQREGDITTQSNVATGADVIREAVRQLCIRKQSEESWYEYYYAFGSDCYFQPQYYESCSKSSINLVPSIDTDQLESCMKDEFGVVSMLERQAAENKAYQIFQWPAVTVNDLLLFGNLIGSNIAQAVCNSLEEVDDNCEQILDHNFKPRESESSSSIFLTLVLVVLGFIFAFFIAAYAYKRIVRREISQDVDQKVNQMVSQYIAFYESRGKNTGDQSDL